jgi:hypothetical protein
MKGVTKKLTFEPKTLEDSMVKDGLDSISLLNNKEPYLLVGGIATQSYLPSLCRRPTSDIDFSVVRPLNYEDFKQMITPVTELLRDHHYNIETVKKSRAFGVEVTNKEGEILCMEFSRRNNRSFERNKLKLERELENAKTKILEGRDKTYFVASPEDIVLPKLVRSIGSLVRQPNLRYCLHQGRFTFSKKKIIKELSKIASLRKEAMLDPSSLNLAEKLRLCSDVYDIRILSEIVGFNSQYLQDAAREWYAIDSPSFEKDFLTSITFPKGIENIFNKSAISV